MGLVVICKFLITHTNQQVSKILFEWYTSSRSTFNTILQYLQDRDPNDDSNINCKILHRGLFTSCGKMTHEENLDQSRNPF